jgi:uncharacterized surface protein with fasciclin (FAS1) repeats
MGNLKYRYIILLSLFIGVLFSACKDNWDEHNKVSDPILTVNLMAQINTNKDLSTFSSYLVKTGFDKIIASSKAFTIWAPTNLALQTLDPAIVNDSARLSQFVAYHISNQSYFTYNPNPVLTIRTLNGKNILFSKTNFEEANIVTADKYVGNGVLHTIDMATPPKFNAWEYLSSTATCTEKTFLQSIDYQFFDPTLAVVTGIDPKTGLPIYQQNTGYITRNSFRQRIADIKNEDAKYTFVILTDAAFTAEKTKLSKYYAIINALATPARNAFVSDSLTSWNIVKDLVFNGAYTQDILPDSLYSSRDSVKVHIDKSAIVETHKVSNGIVYVVNKIDYQMTSKIKPVKIEGENYYANFGSYGTRVINTRRNPNTLVDFRELYLYNHGKASYWFQYKGLYNTVTYKVYWVAVRDFDLTPVAPAIVVTYFSQAVTFGTTAISPLLPYKQVDLLNYNEVYLGTVTVTGYGVIDTFLVGAANTVNGTNSLVLDYIKMVPILN